MNKDQEIINEYNRKRNIEITEEHLHNIERLFRNLCIFVLQSTSSD
ncbi:hypothetical protein [Spiroplasma endosymbiont of Amphimallon solstitiale]